MPVLNKLIIEVVNAENISFEKIKPDPYVLMLFKGIKKKTAFQKSDLNPIWNEVKNHFFKFLRILTILIFIN